MSKFSFKHDTLFNNTHDAFVLVDNETGVNYIVVSNVNTVSVTPRLKSTGDVYVSFTKKETRK